jgi:hypothetical protein
MAFSHITGFKTSDTGAIDNTGRAPETGHRVQAHRFSPPSRPRPQRSEPPPRGRLLVRLQPVSRHQVRPPETQATAKYAGPRQPPSPHVIGDPALTQINQSVQPAS